MLIFKMMMMSYVCKVTQFLHEVGVLLHYDDHYVDELYFIDPGWLFNLMCTTVTSVIKQNLCVKQGIVINKDMRFISKDSHIHLYPVMPHIV